MAARLFASATGPRTTGSATVVARVIRPVDREHRGQGRRSVEPRAGEKQVVVGRESSEAHLLGDLSIFQEVSERPRPSVEAYQG